VCAGFEVQFIGELTKPRVMDLMALVAFVGGYAFGSWSERDTRQPTM
jgi:heme O synthase-like polyprenyltransferase